MQYGLHSSSSSNGVIQWLELTDTGGHCSGKLAEAVVVQPERLQLRQGCHSSRDGACQLVVLQ